MRAALQQIAAADAPLNERLLVAVVGPLVTVVLGTGLVGWIMWRLDQRAVEQRAVEEKQRDLDQQAREEQAKRFEQNRARHDLESQIRRALLIRVLTAASELYLATQHYWRVSGDPDRSPEELEARKVMDDQYRRSRATISVAEMEFEALFNTDEPARLCHRIDDLLTVRYMQLIGKATERLYKLNSLGYEGKDHSGLTFSELKSPMTVLACYRNSVKELARAVLRSPLR